MLFATLAFLASQTPDLPPSSPPPSAAWPARQGAPRDLQALLQADPRCAPIVAKANAHRLQVLLAEPVVSADGRVTLVRSAFGEAGRYFYPASSIKLCGAIAALLAINQLNGSEGASLGLDSKLVIEPRFDGDKLVQRDASNRGGVDGGGEGDGLGDLGGRGHAGLLTVRHALRKLFLVSDNQAYNHCLEITGQDGVNEAMWRAGCRSARLWHRLSEAHPLAENQVTRPVRIDDVRLPGRSAAAKLDNSFLRDRRIGTGYWAGGRLVEGPMSFDQKNAILLRDLQNVLVEVLRPEVETDGAGFPGLTMAQRRFLTAVLGELPRESRNPVYDAGKTPDHACKFVLPGVRRVVPAEHLRVYDKIGRAYGFSTENAYIEDERTGRGFFLAIVLYTNPNGVLNDDRYAYEELADPFLAAVGELVARAVFGD
ncbi:MAG: serine hydrolase [Planctomycetota bacterium]